VILLGDEKNNSSPEPSSFRSKEEFKQGEFKEEDIKNNHSVSTIDQNIFDVSTKNVK
jgi:hypothetical protein